MSEILICLNHNVPQKGTEVLNLSGRQRVQNKFICTLVIMCEIKT
jgi:hypothetical protein